MQSPDNGGHSQYVGCMRLGEKPAFVRLTVTAANEIVLDLPGQFRFNVPGQEIDLAPGHVRFRAGSLVFQGRISGQQLSGTVTDGARSSTFEATGVQPVISADYSRVIGHYRLPTQREIAFSQDIRSDEQLYFYMDADQVVRVYPAGVGRFVSELCETITVDRNASGAGQSLLWQQEGEGDQVATRLAWCHEEEIRVDVDDHVIAGTLLLPLDDGPHPAVIFCHHASVQQRDYYRLFAEPFVQRGIAALIYDKRGWGDSTGTQLTSEISQLADDVVAMFRFAQKHPAIRPDATGIWGISNGAWAGALAAWRLGDAAFMIGASLAGVTPARQEQVRRVNVVRELGASPRAAAMIDRLWEHLFKFLSDGVWTAELESILEQVNADQELQALPKYPGHGPGLQPVPPRHPIEKVRAEWGGNWTDGAFDPAPIYAGLHCPVLCVWGERDTVLPLQEGVARIEQALRNSNHQAFELRVIPGATHMLYVDPPEPEGMLAEVMHTNLHNVSLAPGVRQLMVDWAEGAVS